MRHLILALLLSACVEDAPVDPTPDAAELEPDAIAIDAPPTAFELEGIAQCKHIHRTSCRSLLSCNGDRYAACGEIEQEDKHCAIAAGRPLMTADELAMCRDATLYHRCRVEETSIDPLEFTRFEYPARWCVEYFQKGR